MRRRPRFRASRAFLWTAGGLTFAGLGVLLMSNSKANASARGQGLRAPENYPVDPAAPYGPTFKTRLPPGLPATARRASRYRAALPYVRQVAESYGLGQVFVDTIVELADGESGAMYGLPAHNFDARLVEGYDAARARSLHLVPDPDGPRRPAAASLITAWGVFQWNRDSGRDSGVAPRDWFAWHWTPAEEVEKPIAYYAGLWKRARAAGAPELDAARGVRLWHAEPATFKTWLANGPRLGWSRAWSQVVIAGRIDKHLDTAGVLA